MVLGALLVAAQVFGQVSATVAPRPVALGATVSNQFCNVSNSTITLPSSAPWAIRTVGGLPVFSPIGLPVLTPLNPQQCRTFTWNQRDNLGAQVPAGLYLWDVRWFDPQFNPQTTTVCFEITQAVASLCVNVPFPVNCPIRINYRSPADAGLNYFSASALGDQPGIPLDACRTVPLNVDGLFLFSLCQNAGPVFFNMCGVLDNAGNAQSTVVPPPDPALAGFAFFTAFVTADGSGLRSISTSVRTELAPPGPPCPCGP
jgi:hypothetical protein